MPRPPDRRFYLLLFLFSYAVWLAIYRSVGAFAVTLDAHDLSTSFDLALPVWPQWVWIYDFCFLLPAFLVMLLGDGHAINRLVIAIFVAVVSASVVFLLFPVAHPLPMLGDSLAERWITYHYENDFPPGANKLPSLHVINAILFWLAVRQGSTSLLARGTMLILAILIAVSTLLIKQHLIIDVLLGIPWAFGVWWVTSRLYEPLEALGLGPEDTVRHVRTVVARRFGLAKAR
ncbi:MAG: phosphatase PAP2 family protein [Bacteroidetes bacterium]|nr:phosphatase PAP2 family protein [Bacteroidota bacterium]